MSKNDHVHSRTPAVIGADRPTSGAASLVQGVYGTRGNLELVACDRRDGLWVFWLNCDAEEDAPANSDVPPGSWSAGLHFAGGHRYLDAVILQSTLGPDHLEVLALDEDAVLQSWFWSPGAGFHRRTADVAHEVIAFAAACDVGVVRVTTADGRHLVSDGTSYPERAWRKTHDGPLLQSDAEAPQLLAHASVADVVAGTARVARSTRAGGTVELTWRNTSGAIRHLGLPA